MTTTALSTRGGGGVARAPQPSGLADVVDLILDKGLVIDVYVRVALVGIELLTIDARIVVASVDTYLRFAEAVNRLDLEAKGDQKGLPDLVGDGVEGGASHKAKGALEGAKDSLSELFSDEGGDHDDDDEGDDDRPRRRRRSSSRERPRRRARD